MAGDELFNTEIVCLHEILNDGDLDKLRKMRQTKVFSSVLSKYGVEMITNLSTFLNDKRLYKCPRIVECYEEIFRLIMDDINPEELFITLLEQVDEENCCIEKFLMLLPPLKFSLIKLSSSRGYWLAWTLSTIKCYLESVSFPEDHEVEFDEKKMMVNDPYVDTILQLSEKLSDFYQAFLNDTLLEGEAEVLVSFGFHLLTKPMMCLYLEKFEKLGQICDQIVLGINKLYGKVYFLLQFIDEKNASDGESLNSSNSSDAEENPEPSTCLLWDKIKTFPLAVFYSVYIVDAPFTNYFPLAYCPLYLFHKLFCLSILLMNHHHNAVIRKGLLLCKRIFEHLPDGYIPHHFLEYVVHRQFVKIAGRLSIYSYIFENRKSAVELLRSYMNKFDEKGTYLLYLNVTSVTGSEDIDSEIITIFRKNMFKSFVERNLMYYHKGKYLKDLLEIFAKLSEKSDTDLMAAKNKIVSLLYLFALILRRDTENVTRIRDHFDYFERCYFSVIKEAVEKSREKYKRDAVTFADEDNPLPFEDHVSVVVQGKTLPRLQREDKIKATSNALTALDMIEHALNLVYEYYESRQ